MQELAEAGVKPVEGKTPEEEQQDDSIEDMIREVEEEEEEEENEVEKAEEVDELLITWSESDEEPSED